MITVDFGNSEFVASWVMERLGLRLARPFWAIGFLAGGELRAGVVFNGWNGANLDVSIYGPGMVNRRTIRALYAYAFKGLGARRITARMRVNNRPMRDIVERLGFTYEGIAPDYYPDAHALVFRALRDDCRWLRGHDGRSRTAGPQRNRRSASRDESRNRDYAARLELHKSGHALRQPDL